MDRWIDEPMGSRCSWVLSLRVRLGESREGSRGVRGDLGGLCSVLQVRLVLSGLNTVRLIQKRYSFIYGFSSSIEFKLFECSCPSSPGLERTGSFKVPRYSSDDLRVARMASRRRESRTDIRMGMQWSSTSCSTPGTYVDCPSTHLPPRGTFAAASFKNEPQLTELKTPDESVSLRRRTRSEKSTHRPAS